MFKTVFSTGLAVLSLCAGAVLADSHAPACALSYEVFEASVPHTDMEDCPGSMAAGEDDFCRVAVVAEVATVFVFNYDSNCLVKTQSFDEDAFTFVID